MQTPDSVRVAVLATFDGVEVEIPADTSEEIEILGTCEHRLRFTISLIKALRYILGTKELDNVLSRAVTVMRRYHRHYED